MWQLLAGGMAAIAVAGGAFWLGDSRGYARRDAAAVKAELRLERQGRAADQRAVQASNAVALELAQRRDQIQTIHRTIEREIPRVITPATDARFPVPVGYVRLHDAAAAAVSIDHVHDAAGRPDDAASEVAASLAARTVAFNYGIANDCAARLTAWQDWWRGQVAAAEPP